MSQKSQMATGGFSRMLNKKNKNKEMQVTLTWLMLGSLVSNIWKTGAGSVCWSTWSSCWGWPHTAMALVRWSTPLSNSPGLGKKQVYRPQKTSILKIDQGLKRCRETLHQCSHSYSDMSLACSKLPCVFCEWTCGWPCARSSSASWISSKKNFWTASSSFKFGSFKVKLINKKQI